MAGADVTISEASVVKADLTGGVQGTTFQEIIPLATADNSFLGDATTGEKTVVEEETVHIGSANLDAVEKYHGSENYSSAAPEDKSPPKRLLFFLA